MRRTANRRHDRIGIFHIHEGEIPHGSVLQPPAHRNGLDHFDRNARRPEPHAHTAADLSETEQQPTLGRFHPQTERLQATDQAVAVPSAPSIRLIRLPSVLKQGLSQSA